ncbi:hypothetical protein ACFU3J_05775 [Streptomyces sp. NPDC057411]|uniref:hypothetical protein n=1 Tax=unclassified Streptomyces TaxID=2593676 RepID=UPI003634F497
MEKWAVIAQYAQGDRYVTDVVSRVTGTREDALEALRLAATSYRTPMREKWREVYRLSGGDSYLVIARGAVSLLETTLSIAELVHDTKDWDAWPAAPGDRPPAQ